MIPVFRIAIRCTLLLCFVLFGNDSLAQATPNPCETPSVVCGVNARNGIINSFGSDTVLYATVGRSMPFWFAIGDTNSGHVDTTANCVFNISIIGGPGVIEGNRFTDINKYAYYDSISFTKVGLYMVYISEGYSQLEDTIYFRVPPEVDFCTESPGGDCGLAKGNKIFAKARSSNVIPVDAVFPIKVGVIDSISQMLDSTFVGTIYVEKVSGPGVMYGSLSMTGIKWFDFTNIRFSQEGNYTIKFYEEDSLQYKSTTVNLVVIGTTSLSKVYSPQLQVYPNPFTDQINIDIPQKESDVIVSVFDAMGKKVLEQSFPNPENVISMNAEELKSGVYLLSVLSSGSSIPSKSIIIKK